MSRVGRSPISIPKGTKVEIGERAVTIEGPKGKLTAARQAGIRYALEGGDVVLAREGNSGSERARHGLARALLANAVAGVTQGFSKQLEVQGVGYRGEVKGRELHMSLGYSHPVVFSIPPGITVEIDKQNRITVTGADKQQVGQVAAEIRGLREPDAYKGKGIRYAGEQVRLKVGKAAGGR
jgi:large subunit ribosomal protein L6